MSEKINSVADLSHSESASLIMDMFHRIIIHHALWFTEVRHQMGMEKALEALNITAAKSINIQLKRIGKVLGFEMQDNLPQPLLDLSPETLKELMNAVAVNWLANDGVWFQSVEFKHGMNDAKRCNDSCWAHFSPYEASTIKNFLGLTEQPGLAGLKKALNFRMYAHVNTQSFVEEKSNSFVFQMNECRVQVARKRKGLDPYPCKSVGIVEYSYFARTIDSRIKTEYIGCPPENKPGQWYCAWRFKL